MKFKIGEMETNKFWSVLSMLVMVLCTAVLFSSCKKSSDSKDDPIPSANKLVGKWKYSWEPGCYVMLTFNADGSGNYFEIDDGKIDDDFDFYYTYDDDRSLLTIKEGRDEDKFILTWINNDSFKSDIADKGSIWKRQ